MELHIEGHHTAVEPELHSLITARLEALDQPYEDIMHARVTLLKHEHHRVGSDEARIFLTLSGKTLSASRVGNTLEGALYEVLDVMTRELTDFRAIRRDVATAHGPRLSGRIVRILHDRGYGFIETDVHREVYFQARAVHGISFEQLQPDMMVDIDVEAGHAGPQASRVTPRQT